MLCTSCLYLKSRLTVNWDETVKKNARAALLHAEKGQYDEALQYADRLAHRIYDIWSLANASSLFRAYRASKEAELSTLGDRPYLTISGIGIKYSELCEHAGVRERAIEVLEDSYKFLKAHVAELVNHDKLRLIAIANKLGEVSSETLDHTRTEVWLEQAVKDSAQYFGGASKPYICPELTGWMSYWLELYNRRVSLRILRQREELS